MAQQIPYFDVNRQMDHWAALSPADQDGGPSSGEDRLHGEPDPPAGESSAFAVITSVLMSGLLLAAVGALVRAIARVLGYS